MFCIIYIYRERKMREIERYEERKTQSKKKNESKEEAVIPVSLVVLSVTFLSENSIFIV